MTAILAVAMASLIASFFFSLVEAAFLALSPAKVLLMQQKKVFGGDRLAKLRADMYTPVVATRVCNSLTNTLGAGCFAALVAREIGIDWALGLTVPYALLVVFVTEILPRALGINFAPTLAPTLSWPLQIVTWLAWPLVRVASLLRLLLGDVGRQPLAPTEEEIMALSQLAVQGGHLRPQELRWMQNALTLDNIKAYDLMTPRTVVYSLPADLPLSMVTEHSEHWVHSRLPLTEDQDPDKIVGMVYRREVFDALVKGKRNLRLRDLMKKMDFVPETTRAHQLLDKFITEKKHMLAVVDEYGDFEGLVTLEDVLECLLGSEIVDEHDRHTDMQELARHKARLRGQLSRVPPPAPRDPPLAKDAAAKPE